MTAPRSLAFYLRVSRISQDYRSQLHALREYCRRQGWRLPTRAKIFAEKISGKLAKRTQLDRLLQACRAGHVDTILVFKIDRLGNDLGHLVNLLAEFDRIKIRVVGVSDGVDTSISNAAANFYRNGLATGAQFNREIISERTHAGLAAAAARGRYPGRRRENDAKIAKAIKLRGEGKTFTEIRKIVHLSKGYLSELLNGKAPAAGRKRQVKK